jgi:anthranilate phosphoribosyltransferase
MLEGGAVRRTEIDGTDAGLPRHDPSAIKGGSPEDNAAALRTLLAGAPGPYRDTVLFNAAAALVVASKAADLKEGARLAASSIDDGRAKAKLDRLVAITTGQA